MLSDRTHLAPELLVNLDISLRAIEGLLEPCEKHRDDDDCLESLTEDDEEDRDGEDLRRHRGYCCTDVGGEMGGREEASVGNRMPGEIQLDGHSRIETGH